MRATWSDLSPSLLAARNAGTLLAAPDSDWILDDKRADCIALSNSNKKVKLGGIEHLGLRAGEIFAYGKPAIVSCACAGKCHIYCYAEKIDKQYANSLRIHGHNYAMVYGATRDIIARRFQDGLNLVKKAKLVRLNDDGDFISFEELAGIYQTAINNPHVIFYGYTKMTVYLYRLLRENHGKLVENFRLSVSITDNPVSCAFLDKIEQDYPNTISTCEIIDTPERLSETSELPWNNQEFEAIQGKRNFKIAIHGVNGQFSSKSPEGMVIKATKAEEKITGIKTC